MTQIYDNNLRNLISTKVWSIEGSVCTISKANQMLNALSFGSDPFNVCEYILRRLNNSDFQAIVKMTQAHITPTTYALLQNCQPTSAKIRFWEKRRE